ncbi:hypothetical protein LY76DRAFT_638359 [Colletotrichum caudatum]|nr:hypothetical protein LY76DRAFT_638359 [Colletotrichum caudatum]
MQRRQPEPRAWLPRQIWASVSIGTKVQGLLRETRHHEIFARGDTPSKRNPSAGNPHHSAKSTSSPAKPTQVGEFFPGGQRSFASYSKTGKEYGGAAADLQTCRLLLLLRRRRFGTHAYLHTPPFPPRGTARRHRSYPPARVSHGGRSRPHPRGERERELFLAFFS